MTLNISALERELLLELLDNHYIETMKEENRTDALSLRTELKQRINLIDELREKVRSLRDREEPVYRMRTV